MTASVANQRQWITATMVLIGWILLATGCASMSKEACLSADWRTIGYEDGAKGRKTSHIGNHRQACAEYGVIPDLEQYRQGREQGLTEWCTPGNGYRIGKAGGRYSGVCPSESEARFAQAVDAGRREFELHREVDNQTRRINRLNQTLDELEQDQIRAEADMVRPGIGPQRRRQLLGELRMLEADREALLADIAAKEQALDAVNVQLEQARAATPY